MDAIIPPELLCIICSFLDIEDIRRFRLCCKAFADAGACFAFREVVFYLHHHDLDMLRSISLHPIASKNVRSLVYVGHTLDPTKETLDDFHKSYCMIRRAEMYIAFRTGEAPPPVVGEQQLQMLYKNYEATVDRQENIIWNNADISCIREAISRFTSLQEVTMSCDFWFLKNGRKSPFEGCLLKPNDYLEPTGCRQLDSLLSAIFEADIKLRRLSAGSFSWRFFQKPAAELSRALSLYTNLTCLELCIDTGLRDDRATNKLTVGTEVPECCRMLETGLLRNFIKSLTQLRTLHVVFSWHSEEHGYPARLENIMEPKHRWGHLESLTLGNITCERHDLLSMLRRHKSTMKDLCLRDIRLRSTSWQVLLPKIRRTMDLEEACICGELYGLEEGSPFIFTEYWDLGYPDEFSCLREDVNDYLVYDIRRCPLNSENGRLD
ncbi:hypothetical protein F4677DRAFT_156509 [Hypoxylon crocopeplum]|nr:hypothetical protein F4677DRAFT_156509 [Hypoxylon crocopeplum]